MVVTGNLEWWLQYIVLPGLVVIVTAVLAAITFYYARETAKIARLTAESVKASEDMTAETKKMAEATERMAETSYKAYLASLKPQVEFSNISHDGTGDAKRFRAEIINRGNSQIRIRKILGDIFDEKTGQLEGSKEKDIDVSVVANGRSHFGFNYESGGFARNVRVLIEDVAGNREWFGVQKS